MYGLQCTCYTGYRVYLYPVIRDPDFRATPEIGIINSISLKDMVIYYVNYKLLIIKTNNTLCFSIQLNHR